MNVAIELGSLEIRKLFKDLNSTALDKKVNMDYLEKELGLRKFFSQSLIDSQKVREERRADIDFDAFHLASSPSKID